MITQERLRELLSYDPSTGLFTTLVRRGQKSKVGHVEYRMDVLGYRTVTLDGKQYRQHRLVWLYVHGVWPNIIDHADGDKTNNRLGNLRNATFAENIRNQKKSKANTSGHKGVSFCKWTGKWSAEIRVNRTRHRLGRFDNILDARDAYVVAAKLHHKDYARLE